MKKRKGLFITFEGIDGCGKSTQAKKLFGALKKSGFPVVFIREPGGTPVSEKIRKVLLDRRIELNALGELFLYQAARANLTEKIIIPALNKNQIVICDRFFDSTTAYQGYGRKLDLNLIEKLNKSASFDRNPDMTFILDVDYETSLKRRNGKPDRLEKEKRVFFNRVRKGFRDISNKKRVILLDGRDDIETIFAQILSRVLKKIGAQNINA
ncbi:MAG: dTMP kinase [candidate division Zixibacteria bacterium]